MIEKELMINGAREMGIGLSGDAVKNLILFSEFLSLRNETMNLTAITDPRGVAVKHFLDSLSLLAVTEIPEGASVIDIGTGAGFPGIPIRLARPDLRLTLLDSLAKRVSFLNDALEVLDIRDVTVLNARAEERGRDPAFREKYDFAVSRAVAPLPALCEYCLPYVRVGGAFLAMKGSGAPAELEAARPAIKALSSELAGVRAVSLPGGVNHAIIVIRKLRHISPEYPRKQSKIVKSPIN